MFAVRSSRSKTAVLNIVKLGSHHLHGYTVTQVDGETFMHGAIARSNSNPLIMVVAEVTLVESTDLVKISFRGPRSANALRSCSFSLNCLPKIAG